MSDFYAMAKPRRQQSFFLRPWSAAYNLELYSCSEHMSTAAAPKSILGCTGTGLGLYRSTVRTLELRYVRNRNLYVKNTSRIFVGLARSLLFGCSAVRAKPIESLSPLQYLSVSPSSLRIHAAAVVVILPY